MNDIQLFRNLIDKAPHNKTQHINWSIIETEYLKTVHIKSEIPKRNTLRRRYLYLRTHEHAWNKSVNSVFTVFGGDSETLLTRAIRLGNTRMVDVLLGLSWIDINFALPNGASPLYVACEYDRVDIVKKLMRRPEIDINKCMDNGWNPFLKSCSESLELVELLLPRVNVEHRNNMGESGLFIALRFHKYQVANELLEQSMNLATLLTNGGQSVLDMLSINDETHILERVHLFEIITRHALIRQLVNHGWATPLVAICEHAETEYLTDVSAHVDGHYKMARLLLDMPGIDVNKADLLGNTPLIYAIEKDFSHMTEILLNKENILVNQADDFGNTPLIIACTMGAPDLVERLLLMPEIDVNIVNTSGNTALVVAITTTLTNLTVIKSLLQHPDMDPNVCGLGEKDGVGFDGILYAPLTHAIWDQKREVTNLLLEHPRINVNQYDSKGYTVLLAAIAINKRTDVFDAIIALLNHNDIDINLGSLNGVIPNGLTPLGLAMRTMDMKVTEQLLDDRRIIAEKLFSYGECTMSAIGYLCNLPVIDEPALPSIMEMMEFVLRWTRPRLMSVININAFVGSSYPQQLGGTLLHTAITRKQEQMVELILNQDDIDVNVLDRAGLDVLNMAIRHQLSIKMIEIMLQKGSKINQADPLGRTPLNNACLKYETMIVRLLLLQDGIDINLADNNGMTPLCNLCSVFNERQYNEERTALLNIIHRLIEKGVDVNQSNNEGMTPLDFVVLNNRGSDIGFHQWTDTSPQRSERGFVNIATLLWNHGGRQGIPQLVQKGLKQEHLREKIFHGTINKKGGGATVRLVGKFLNMKEYDLKF